MVHLYKGPRPTGRLKSVPEDFIVEEITETGAVLEIGQPYNAQRLGMTEGGEGSKFSAFIMQKRAWNTSQALGAVARRLGRGIRSMGFAGTKDRNAVSVQLCSIFGAMPKQLSFVHIKDISINGAWRSDNAVEMGQLAGNRFTITVRHINNPNYLDSAIAALDGRFPNYFGAQRFGVRGNNADIGMLILKGDFEGAARAFLTGTANETNADAVAARERLADEWDFGNALLYFPRYLKYERLAIDYLSRFPGNYANALRRLPRSILLMFIHAVEAQVFNSVLEERVRSGRIAPGEGDNVCPANALGFPDYSSAHAFSADESGMFVVGSVVGYDSEVSAGEARVLEGLGIEKDMFRVKGMPELNAKGTSRVLFAPYVGMERSFGENDARLRFSLPAGSYATTLLEELVGGETGAE